YRRTRAGEHHQAPRLQSRRSRRLLVGHETSHGVRMSNRMWGGRFSAGPDAIMEEINASIGFDHRLYRQDIAGSIAHARMLAACGILTEADRDAIVTGLAEVEAEIEAG